MPIEISDLPTGKTSHRFEGGPHGSSVSCFLVDGPPGTGPRLHRHPYEETFILQGGSATFSVDGETIEARAGQIVIAPAGAAHKFVVTGDERLRMVTIHPAPQMQQEDLEDGEAAPPAS
jgi:quercetin dioxygenase-like cupin family protein